MILKHSDTPPRIQRKGLIKLLLMMKFIILFVFATCLELGATGYSQKITISKDDVSLKKIFKEIEKQSAYNFFYKDKLLKGAKDVSIHVKEATVEEALNICFKDQSLSYTILEKLIVIKAKKAYTVIVPTAAPAPEEIFKPITGTVKDQAGNPLEGVSVLVKGSTQGTSTNSTGDFAIEAEQGQILEFSIVGYQTRSVTVGASNTITVIMQIEATIGSEVVVVGYGTQKRQNVTAAISTIQAKDIVTTTSASLSQNLQGKIPGLQIRHQNGEPGSFSSSINIRGFGNPLYVIDGIVRDGRIEFNQLNPNDIESISVLKDASAAIYGLNAANGVILVTTKKGISGKPVFNYSGVFGMQQPTNIPKMATAAQYLEMYDNAIYFRNGTHSISKEELEKWKTGAPGYESTDWYGETFKKNALQQQHDFSVRGGSDKVKYFVSLGHFNEGGLFKSNDINYERYNFRSNLTVKLTDDLTADVLLSGRYSDREYPGGDGFIWIYKGSVVSHPNEKPYIDGNPDYPANIYIQQNPVLMAQKEYAGYTRNEDKSFRSSAVLTYKAPFAKGLEIKGTAAYDSYNMFNKSVWKNYKVYNEDLTSQVINPPRISNSIDDVNRLVFQGQVSYNKSFGNGHNIDATGVVEQNRYNKKYSFLKREYEFFTTDIVDYASGLQTNQGREEEEATVSYIGRLNYDYQGKYMASYGFRYDGSYRYAPGKRWAFFPTVSAGWRISEEVFFKNNLRFVDDMKFRASYGAIGENVGAPFQHVLGFSPNTNQGAEFENGSFVGGLAAPGVINPNFTWVKSTILDFGVELRLWKGLLSFEADYYERAKTGKLKARVDGLPNTFGGNMPIENLEDELTRGFDFVVSHRNNINKFQYGVSFNANLARTMWTKVDKPDATSSWDNWKYGYLDRWNDREWGYSYTGQFQNKEDILHAPIQGFDQGNTQLLPGDFQYADNNGDGIIDNKDRLPLFRNQDPKLFYGFTLNAAWNNFDISTIFQGAGLYTIRFNEVFSQMFFNDGNIPAYFYDRWHKADLFDPSSEWLPGKWPANRFLDNMGSNYHESDRWRINATYLRMKSLEIGYSFPQSLIRNIRLDNVRIYANAQNLLTFSDPFLKQFDPEKSEGDYNAGYNYPLTKSFNFGINVSF